LSLTLVAGLTAALCLMFIRRYAMARGILLGSVFSAVNFHLMGLFLPLTLGTSRARATMIGLGSVLLRYGLLSIPLVAGMQSDRFDFAAVALGLFAVQIVTLLEYALVRPVLTDNK
jgi:hypothetical protein